MEGKIDGEDDDGVGLRVFDNNSIEHRIAVDFDGNIFIHEQDGYSDYPSDRTPEENEHVNQARRFAKWHVYRERGYETLPRYENPDHIVSAMLALAGCSDSEIETGFSDLQNQLRSHFNDSPVELPFDDADPDSDIIIYRKDIYVQPDPTTTETPLADQFTELIGDPREMLQRMVGDTERPLETLAAIFTGEAEPAVALPEFELEAVSDLHYLHSDGVDEQTHRNDPPLEREPDARIELLPVDADVFESYRQFLGSHLLFQARDYYLLMGCEPPEPFQQQGLGCYQGFRKQQILDMYETYFLASDSVDSWDMTSR